MGPIPTRGRDTANDHLPGLSGKSILQSPLACSGLFPLFHDNVTDPQNQILTEQLLHFNC